MGIGRRIRDRRAELKMSSTELAEKIGVSKQTVSGYELERTYPNPEKLIRFWKLWNVTQIIFIRILFM